MKMKNIINFLGVLTVVCLFSCDKHYLDVKSDKSMVIPASLRDFQAMLDNRNVMNAGVGLLLGEISSDNFYIERKDWLNLSSAYEKNGYVWAKDIFQGSLSSDWNNSSLAILYANIALEGVEKMAKNDQNKAEWNYVKGSALFLRSLHFYHMAQLFCKTFIRETASNDLGIPLRLESDLTIVSKRATVMETYTRIIEDLKLSAELLPQVSSVKTRPSRAAAYALLSRVYLVTGEYESCKAAAKKALEDYNTLIDYNTVNIKANYPFQLYNDEVVFHCNLLSTSVLISPRMKVNKALYDKYAATDIRKTAWYYPYTDGSGIGYKGSYNGSLAFFSGLSIGEIYFNLIESLARTGNNEEARKILNEFLISRYSKGAFEPITTNEAKELMDIILVERRKELAFRGLRWTDLRRLNLEENRKETVSRNLGEETFYLYPNSQQYVLPIPESVIKLTGMSQNERE